jgi:hypothetical protein
VAHPEHDERDGEARGGLVRRNRLLPPSEKTRSMTVLREAMARFLLPCEQVEHGDDDGELGDAWGGSRHRRKEMAGVARVSIWGKIQQRGRKNGG